MRLVNKSGDILATGRDWSGLVGAAMEILDWPKCSAFLAAQWWVADVSRMKEASVATLEAWLLSEEVSWWECPFDEDNGGQELEEGCVDNLFDVASACWAGSGSRWYTRIGMLRALRKAAKEPVKTTEELARMWATEMNLTVEEDSGTGRD